MTREEAKVFLLQLHTDKQLNKSEHEALRVAIKALEAPPNDNWEGYSKRLWKSAYERGKAEQTIALDKIRTEIIQMPTISFNANDIYKADVLAIIDKYKTESEE